jgi:uncharacterized RDD family membrane protein YckC
MSARSSIYQPSGPQTRPWLRWAARYFDVFLFSFVISTILYLIYPSAFNILDKNKSLDKAFQLFLVLAYVFVEPIMLCTWGTTPGKAIFKIRLRQKNGEKLSYSQGLSRSCSVFTRGLGLGNPIIALFTLVYSYNHLTHYGITVWDRNGDFSVSHQVIGLLRGTAIALIFIVIIGLIVLGMMEG